MNRSQTPGIAEVEEDRLIVQGQAEVEEEIECEPRVGVVDGFSRTRRHQTYDQKWG